MSTWVAVAEMTLADGIVVGTAAGALVGYFLGRWSVLIFLPQRRHQRGQPVSSRPQVTRAAAQVQVKDAGQYVRQMGVRACGGGQGEPPEFFARVR